MEKSEKECCPLFLSASVGTEGGGSGGLVYGPPGNAPKNSGNRERVRPVWPYAKAPRFHGGSRSDSLLSGCAEFGYEWSLSGGEPVTVETAETQNGGGQHGSGWTRV